MAVTKKQGRFRSEVDKKGLCLTSLRLTKESILWMQKLSNEMKDSGGYRLPRSYILRSMLKAFKRVDVDVSGVTTEDELEARFLESIRKYGK